MLKNYSDKKNTVEENQSWILRGIPRGINKRIRRIRCISREDYVRQSLSMRFFSRCVPDRVTYDLRLICREVRHDNEINTGNLTADEPFAVTVICR